MTVLFYDIVNSTSFLDALDPEEFGNAQRVIHTTAAAVVQRNGGYLHQITGDGGCAFFGYPDVVEDAAECAVEAALELIQRCRKSRPSAGDGPPMQIRVGVATGTVVVNNSAEAGLPETHEIFGLAINLAARLQSFAAADTAIVSDTTYKLTRAAFDYRPVDPVALKGFREPQRVWQPLAKRDAELSFEIRRRPDTPLVARTQELELALDCWGAAQTGKGRVLFLTGEAGIGKSRLVSELLHRLDSVNCDRRLFQCQPRGNRRPFHAIVDRLYRELRQSSIERRSGSGAVRGYIALTAPGVRQESVEILSLLADSGPDPAHGQDLIDVPNQDFGQAAVGAMIDVLSAWLSVKPQLIILEDFQWADALTKTLVARVIEEIRSMRVLLVITSRDPVDSDLAGRPSVVTRDLSRLSPEDIAQLVEGIWNPTPMPKDLPAFIEERSEGVPLFAEELAYLLREQFGNGRSGRVDWERVLKRDGVFTLKDLLLARITGLGAVLRVVQTASVIGREFSHDLLSLLTEEIPPELLVRHLETLIEKDIIHATGDEGEPSFRFRHFLFQEAAYESLLKSEQRELHNRIITSSLHNGFPKLSDDIMAWHCEQAGRFQEAAQYAIKAAESCAIRSAVHEAYSLLSSAEMCLSHLSDGPERDDLRLRLLATRGPIEMALFGSGSREACRTYDEAVAICRQKGLAGREQWFPLYWGWWVTSPNAEAVVRSRIIVSDLESATDPEIKLQALHCSWATHFHAGNHRECLECISRGLELYDAERAVSSRTKYGGHDAKVCALAERGQSLWFRGDLASAAESVNAALRWAEEIDHLGSVCHALDVALLFNHFEQNIPEVLRLSDRMRSLADQYSLPNCEAKSDIFSGWARTLNGEVAEGRAMFERGLKHQREIGTEEDLPLYLDMRAATLSCEGRHDLALLAIEEALDHADRTSDAFWLSELYRRRAVLGERCGRPRSLALQDLEHALSLAEAQGAQTLLQRVRSDLQTVRAFSCPHYP